MSDITNFNFEDQLCRMLMRDDAPWWVAKDTCRVLGIANNRDALSRLDDDEKDEVGITDTIGRNQKTTVINESGLYSLILTSRKPAAKRFKKWVTSIVLPQIRKTGAYVHGGQAKPDLQDDYVFGVKVACLNAAARTVTVIERIYGSDAARALWEKDPNLPQVREKSVQFAPNSEDDDPQKCLEHLIAHQFGDGLCVGQHIELAFHDKGEAKKLRDWGLYVAPGAEVPHLKVLNAQQKLDAVYAGTLWSLNWQAALIQLDGASNSHMPSLGKKQKSVSVPKSTFFKILRGMGL